MWLTYCVLGIQINHSINGLLSCRVPAGAPGLELLGWNTYGGAGENTPKPRDVSGGREMWQALPSFFQCMAWPACCGKPRTPAQWRHRGMACDRTMLLQEWHEQGDGATLDSHSCATKPWKGGMLWGALWFCWLYVRNTGKGSVSAELVRDAALPLMQQSSYRTLSCVLVCL